MQKEQEKNVTNEKPEDGIRNVRERKKKEKGRKNIWKGKMKQGKKG